MEHGTIEMRYEHTVEGVLQFYSASESRYYDNDSHEFFLSSLEKVVKDMRKNKMFAMVTFTKADGASVRLYAENSKLVFVRFDRMGNMRLETKNLTANRAMCFVDSFFLEATAA